MLAHYRNLVAAGWVALKSALLTLLLGCLFAALISLVIYVHLTSFTSRRPPCTAAQQAKPPHRFKPPQRFPFKLAQRNLFRPPRRTPLKLL